jgi:hypothetical protein
LGGKAHDAGLLLVIEQRLARTPGGSLGLCVLPFQLV